MHPSWFEKLGGWTNEASIAMFAEWSATAFKLFGARIKLWATFNEINCFTFLAYMGSAFPPGRLLQMRTAGKVICHMLRAHVAAYRAIRALPDSGHALIGIVHQHITFEPRANNALHCLAKWASKWMTYWCVRVSCVTLAFWPSYTTIRGRVRCMCMWAKGEAQVLQPVNGGVARCWST